MREQVCLYMCPYARFSERDVRLGYTDRRLPSGNAANPRGSTPVAAPNRSRPGSVTVSTAMSVCRPARTGIDIRDGLQYECIACFPVHRCL